MAERLPATDKVMIRDDSSKALENAARFSANKGLAKYTRFLDPAQSAASVQTAREYGVRFTGWGGYEGAERTVGCFHPFDMEPETEAFCVVCLHARYPSRFGTLTHRDLLGAFMSLGLTRDCIGDIIIVEEEIFLFCLENTAGFIAESMTGAGRIALHFKRLDPVPPMPEPKGSRFSSVVSSLRLDAMLAAAYRLSRSEAAEMIRAGLVKVDHLPCERTDFVLKDGALLSVRGKGRIRFVSQDGVTRKQRIGVSFFRYE